MKNIRFDFYGFVVSVSSDTEGVIELLRKDFSYFETENANPNFLIVAEKHLTPSLKIPGGLDSKKQNQRAITYENANVRYNDFYGKAVSILDYDSSTMEVFYKSEEYLHEILYLAILSRETKHHDLHGLHKIHAFGVAKNNTALIGMMSMKGGKTTLFSYFLDQEGFDIISDDTPLINKNGEILSFPIRIGFEKGSYSSERLQSYDEKAYILNREEYGPKKLVDIKEFSNPIARNPKRVILFQGIRWHGKEDPKIVKIAKLKMFKYLLKNMIVGVGLPMVLEYYLESGLGGIFKDVKIILRRTIAALMLLKRSSCYEVYMGANPAKNYQALKHLLD